MDGRAGIPGLHLCLATLAAMCALGASACADEFPPAWFTWEPLPSVPAQAGAHVSIAALGRDLLALEVAPGADTAGAPSLRVWSLAWDAEQWRGLDLNLGPLEERLPPVRHRQGAITGTLVSAGTALVSVGGPPDQPSTAVLRLEPVEGALRAAPLPDLPAPRAAPAAAVEAPWLYVAGGADERGQGTAEVWRIRLDAAEPAWETLPPLPGPGRAAPGLAAQDGVLYAAGGVAGPADNAMDAEQARAAFMLRQGQDWAPIAAAPVPPGGAALTPFGQNHLLTIPARGGEPGGPDSILAYHTITGTWTPLPLPGEVAGNAELAAWERGLAVLAEDGAGRHAAWRALPQRHASAFGLIDYAVVAGYFIILVGMGAYFSRRERSTERFFLGGRKVPWWAVGISIFGTSLSAITYLSIPAKSYATDWVFFLTNMATVIIAPAVAWYYVPRFRDAPVTTAYEYLERRFNLAARIYGSVVFLMFQAGRMSIVLLLPALALAAATGLDVVTCILAMGVLATVYTVLGGIEAVIWTDVVQTVVLMAGALLALGIVFANVDGGASGTLAMAHEAGKFHTFDWTWDMTATTVWVCLVANTFAYLYPSTADQTVVQRYLTTATVQDAQRAVWTNALLAIPTAFLFYGLGSALWVYYRTHPEMIDPSLQTDAILPLFIVERFPAGLAGLILAGVFAAAMSSLDSSMNSAAAVLVNDYYRRFLPGASDWSALWLARLLTCLFGILATALAVYMAAAGVRSLFDQYNKLLGLTGGGLAGLMALGVFSKRVTAAGGLTGAVASAGIVFLVQERTSLHFLAYGAAGFWSCVVIGWVASLLSRAARPRYRAPGTRWSLGFRSRGRPPAVRR